MLTKLKNKLREFKWLVVYPFTRNRWKDTSLNKYLKSKYNIENVTVSKLKQYKTSDTLFVLAAGQSINNLTVENLKEIRASDSIGVNGFAYHNFVPTFHSFELENQHNPTALKMFLGTSKNIIRLKDNYKNTAIIFRQHKIKDKVLEENIKQIIDFGNSYWNIHDQIPGKTLKEYKKYLKSFYKKGLFEKDDFFPNKSSSMSWVIAMAYQLKYKKIVFCGVDLIGDHFYNNPAPLTKNEYELQKDKVHLTGNKTEKYSIVIQDVIQFWDDYFFKKYGAKLYVSSEYSLLSNVLPVYKFKNK